MARIYLTGHVTIEGPDALVEEGALPGRQGRLALVYLALDARPVPRGELAEAIWQEPPTKWEGALSALVSKLRAVLSQAGLEGSRTLTGASGCYALRLGTDDWVDVQAAVNALDVAEGELRSGDVAAAWSHATVASAVLRRPLLAGEDAPWIDQRRRELRQLLMRSLHCLADVWLRRGTPALAAKVAEDMIRLEPFWENGYQWLMRAHLDEGNRAEALRAYERCRLELRDSLGVDPSPEIEAVYLEALG